MTATLTVLMSIQIARDVTGHRINQPAILNLKDASELEGMKNIGNRRLATNFIISI